MSDEKELTQRIASLEAALARERARSLVLERRAVALEEAAKRAYQMTLSPRRHED